MKGLLQGPSNAAGAVRADTVRAEEPDLPGVHHRPAAADAHPGRVRQQQRHRRSRRRLPQRRRGDVRLVHQELRCAAAGTSRSTSPTRSSAMAAIAFIVAQMGVSGPWTHRYTVTADVLRRRRHPRNNEVYMNGSRVGYVGDVSVTGGKASVQLVLSDPKALPLHGDASAEVRKKNLLGETYIDLQRGSGSGDIGRRRHHPREPDGAHHRDRPGAGHLRPADRAARAAADQRPRRGHRQQRPEHEQRGQHGQPAHHRAERPRAGALGAPAAGPGHRARAAAVLQRPRQAGAAGPRRVRHLEPGDGPAGRAGGWHRRHRPAGRQPAQQPRRADHRRVAATSRPCSPASPVRSPAPTPSWCRPTPSAPAWRRTASTSATSSRRCRPPSRTPTPRATTSGRCTR